MSREIVFRGKRLQGDNWIEGYFYKSDINKRIRESGKATLIFTPDCDTFIMVPKAHNSFMVHADTVGQYTGLTDKNGKKIFEGDIVVWTSKVTRLIGNYTYCFDGYHEGDVLKVVCNEAGFMLARLDDSIPDVPNGSSKIDNYAFWNFHRLLEVIGNIHDNPELMEE